MGLAWAIYKHGTTRTRCALQEALGWTTGLWEGDGNGLYSWLVQRDGDAYRLHKLAGWFLDKVEQM